jgi:hypothetical protein
LDKSQVRDRANGSAGTGVEVVPQYRGYDFFVVRDEIVIVSPCAKVNEPENQR